MLFTFLEKHKSKAWKKKLVETMILSLRIPQDQKDLYISALNVLNEKELNNLYLNLISFVKDIELKEIEDIHKQNFSDIAGMQRKEAEEKKKEMNSFSFLLHNL